MMNFLMIKKVLLVHVLTIEILAENEIHRIDTESAERKKNT